MQADSFEFRRLVDDAHQGDADAVAKLLELYRSYLNGLAQRRISSRLNRRMGVSDLVQQTLIEAYQNFHRFAGNAEDQLTAWLRRILHCNISNAIRDHLYAQKRALTLEQSLQSGLHHGDEVKRDAVYAPTTTPSLQASQLEESIRLLDRLEDLPPEQASAVRMRYLECRSISEIADELKRTKAAAAGLVKRGMQKLRQNMTDS